MPGMRGVCRAHIRSVRRTDMTETTNARVRGRRTRHGFIRRLRRNEDGATALEFAFVAAPFLAFLLMTIEDRKSVV